MKLEEELKTAFRNEEHKATLNLFFTSNWLNQFYNREFRKLNLTTQQFNILRILRGQKGSPVTIGDIKERMIEKESDVSRVVEKMRHNGLIERCISKKDRRVAEVTITKKGLELLGQIDELQPDFDGIMSKLSKKELQTLNKLLNKLRSLNSSLSE
ncbi:MAG: MarR family winged helix-turn-helix transcriptional regulator [Bacteroidota bacterium]